MTYVERMYNSFLRQPWSKYYVAAGIYKITINGKLAYIGKSKNVLYRMAQHFCAMCVSKEHKYQVFAEARKRGYKIRFDMLDYAISKDRDDLEAELGYMEGVYIRKLKPPLNEQIPRESGWSNFTINERARTITLDEIMEGNE